MGQMTEPIVSKHWRK